MRGTDYRDLDETPETTHGATKTLAAHTAHLARLLQESPYPSS